MHSTIYFLGTCELLLPLEHLQLAVQALHLLLALCEHGQLRGVGEFAHLNIKGRYPNMSKSYLE